MTSVFDKKQINTGRQFEFDVAKAFAISFMVLVHVMDPMTVSTGPVYYIIEFLGCPPAAGVFMLAMGVGMVYTKHNSPREFAIRGIKLLVMAYSLNFFRETILLIIGDLLGIEHGYADVSLFSSFMMVDILHFAGLAFLLTALLKKLKIKTWLILCVAVILHGISDACLGAFENASEYVQYPLGLLFYTNKDTAFPLFAWYIYPIIGMCLGQLLLYVKNKNEFYKRLFAIGCSITFFVTAGCYALNVDILDFFCSVGYYQQNILCLLWCLSIVITLIPMYYALSIQIKGKVASMIKYLSANVNTIYITQWLVITYTIAILELCEIGLFDTIWTIPIGLIITVVCVLISILCNRTKSR